MPDAPYALVEHDSEVQQDLFKIGWVVTDSQDGWDHMEPPQSQGILTNEVWLQLWREALPGFDWRISYAGLGLGVWGFKDGLQIAANCIGTGAARSYLAYIGPTKHDPKQTVGPLRCTTHQDLVAEVLVELHRRASPTGGTDAVRSHSRTTP